MAKYLFIQNQADLLVVSYRVVFIYKNKHNTQPKRNSNKVIKALYSLLKAFYPLIVPLYLLIVPLYSLIVYPVPSSPFS